MFRDFEHTFIGLIDETEDGSLLALIEVDLN